MADEDLTPYIYIYIHTGAKPKGKGYGSVTPPPRQSGFLVFPGNDVVQSQQLFRSYKLAYFSDKSRNIIGQNMNY